MMKNGMWYGRLCSLVGAGWVRLLAYLLVYTLHHRLDVRCYEESEKIRNATLIVSSHFV